MKWFKALFSLLITLFALGLGIVIALYNSAEVSLDLWQWQLMPMSLGMLVLLVFALGCLIGLSINMVWVWRLQAARRRLSKELQNSVKRVEAAQ